MAVVIADFIGLFSRDAVAEGFLDGGVGGSVRFLGHDFFPGEFDGSSYFGFVGEGWLSLRGGSCGGGSDDANGCSGDGVEEASSAGVH